MKDPKKIKAFEDDFKRACLAHGINAAFVIAQNDGAKGSLLSIGGSSELSDYIERCLLPHTVEGAQPRH